MRKMVLGTFADLQLGLLDDKLNYAIHPLLVWLLRIMSVLLHSSYSCSEWSLKISLHSPPWSISFFFLSFCSLLNRVWQLSCGNALGCSYQCWAFKNLSNTLRYRSSRLRSHVKTFKITVWKSLFIRDMALRSAFIHHQGLFKTCALFMQAFVQGNLWPNMCSHPKF